MFQCEISQFAKHTQSPYPINFYKSSNPFVLVHSDIWGPSRVPTPTGSRWFITLIDGHTRLCWVYIMKDKSNTGQIFQAFHGMIVTQFQTKI